VPALPSAGTACRASKAPLQGFRSHEHVPLVIVEHIPKPVHVAFVGQAIVDVLIPLWLSVSFNSLLHGAVALFSPSAM
jgi:hypothetical protein